MIIKLDDPEEYKKNMSYPLFFEIHAQTDNYEMYEMRIVAKSEEQAENAGRILCDSLGLYFTGAFEIDIKTSRLA
jgi:hypothetical protein